MTTKMVVFEGAVQSEWIDYNGHMNDACYVQVFSEAIDSFMLRIGLDEAFRARHQVSIYTLQCMVHYLQEVGEGEPLRVEVQLLESDDKRLRVFFSMLHAGHGGELAAMEALLMHIDMSLHRAAPFRAETQAQVEEIRQAHAGLAWPALAGRSIALRRPRS